MNNFKSIKFQNFINSLSGQIWYIDINNQYIAANTLHATFINKNITDIPGKNTNNILNEENANILSAIYTNVINTETNFNEFIELKDQNNQIKIFSLSASIVKDNNQNMLGIACHAIEDQKNNINKDEKFLTKIQKKHVKSINKINYTNFEDIFNNFPLSEFKFILNSIPYGIVIIDMEKRIRFINDTALELSGYSSKDDLTGQICHRTLCPTEMNNCPILDKGMEFDRTERKVLTESGNEIPVLKTALKIKLGKEKFLLETFIDLRNMKDLADAFRKSEEKYETIFENTGSGMVTYDENMKIILVNKKMLDISGENWDYFKNKPSFTDHIIAGDITRVKTEHEKLTKKENSGEASKDIEFKLRKSNGDIRNIHAKIVVIPGTKISIASLLDITDLRNTEKALVISNNKLKTLFKITRHDINNQLTALSLIFDMINNSENISSENKLIEKAFAITDTIYSQIEFTKEYENVGLEKPIWDNFNETLNLVSKNYNFRDIKIHNHIRGNLSVFCDRMIDKVLFNLFDNSIRHGKYVTNIDISFKNKKNSGIITIKDNGIGIQEKIKSDIFKEGFGKNTGFGLFILKSILEITGIGIQENGIYGEGASFDIIIPEGNYRIE